MGQTEGKTRLRGLPQADRLPFIEGIRGLLALYVALGHAASMADPSGLAGKVSRAPDWLQNLMAPLSHGHVAVAAFIVLSGYCLQLSLYVGGQDGRVRNLKRYARRRALRILPPYYAALVISLVVALTITSRFEGYPFEIYKPVTAENVVAHFFLVHNFSTGWMYKINGVLWSIAIEAQLYVLFPFLAIRMRRMGRPIFLIAVTAISIALFLALPEAPKLYPWYIALFALGMVGAAFAYRPPSKIGVTPSFGGIVTLASVAAFFFGLWAGWPLWALDTAGGFATVGVSYWFSVSPEVRAARWLGTPVLVALGGFSYSLYLVHHPVMQGLWWVKPTGGEVADFFYLLLTMPVVLGASYAFSLAFERPFLPPKTSLIPTGGERIPTGLPLQTVHGSWFVVRGPEMESTNHEPRTTNPLP